MALELKQDINLTNRKFTASNSDLEEIMEHSRSLFWFIDRYVYHASKGDDSSDLSHDLLSHTVLKAATKIHTLKDRSKLKNWLYTIVNNTCHDYYRRRKTQLKRQGKFPTAFNYIDGIGESKGEFDIPDTKEEQAKQAQLKEKLSNQIKEECITLAPALPLLMRAVFLLYYVQGLKHKEIAKILNKSYDNSKALLYEARKRIKAYVRSDKNHKLWEIFEEYQH